MRLETYLKIHGVLRKEFAELVDCNPTTICDIVAGSHQPRPELAETIEKVTGGLVTVEELCYDDDAGPIGLDQVRAAKVRSSPLLGE